MKKLLVILLIAVVGYWGYQKYSAQNGPPRPIENPVYGEVRVNANIQGREIEMALFFRATDDADCHGRALVSWTSTLKNCEQCSVQTTNCQAELPPRYARLFDDVPIPSAYLSANAGVAGERDGRIVVYGLTDRDGAAICEVMRKTIAETYKGETHCVAASGG